MTEHTTASNANELLQRLVGQPLQYTYLYQQLGLYDIGFGEYIEIPGPKGTRQVCPHTLHVVSGFEVIWKNGERRVDTYYEDTPAEEFHSGIQPLIGLCVKRVALSDKNDLWLDFGSYWVVFITYENNEESWRFFTPGSNAPHLVASDTWFQLDY